MRDLGTLGGSDSEARGINSNGVVVGSSTLDGPQGVTRQAFRYARGRMVGLGTLEGGNFSLAQAINDAGLIVGISNGTGFEDSIHAFLYEDGVMTDIGSLGDPVYANGINDRGQVVGRSGNVGFLYADKRMADLNSMVDCPHGWRVTEAYGINNAQQIVAAVTSDTEGLRFVRLDRVETEGAVDEALPEARADSEKPGAPAITQ
jgi:probable HAF family extracellular repeat protein